MKKINWDIVVSCFSWLIVLVLFYAAFNIIHLPITGKGPVTQLVGPVAAKVFWTLVYSGEAIALMVAKFYRRKTLRKNVLLVIYLTGIFVSVLSLSINGLGVKTIANIVFTASAAICWLYWKFKTEYVNPKQFRDEIDSMRTDLPRT